MQESSGSGLCFVGTIARKREAGSKGRCVDAEKRTPDAYLWQRIRTIPRTTPKRSFNTPT